MEIAKRVESLIEKPVNEAGYVIDSVTYQKEEGIYYLRVIIVKSEPITIDDCVAVSKIINPILDENDFIKDNYILDVCSK